MGSAFFRPRFEKLPESFAAGELLGKVRLYEE